MPESIIFYSNISLLKWNLLTKNLHAYLYVNYNTILPSLSIIGNLWILFSSIKLIASYSEVYILAINNF